MQFIGFFYPRLMQLRACCKALPKTMAMLLAKRRIPVARRRLNRGFYAEIPFSPLFCVLVESKTLKGKTHKEMLYQNVIHCLFVFFQILRTSSREPTTNHITFMAFNSQTLQQTTGMLFGSSFRMGERLVSS